MNITEQFTGEQEVCAVDTASDVDSSVLELSVEASHTKGSEPLSLTDNAAEVIVRDSLPTDTSIVEDDDDQAKVVATIPGWFSQINWINISFNEISTRIIRI